MSDKLAPHFLAVTLTCGQKHRWPGQIAQRIPAPVLLEHFRAQLCPQCYGNPVGVFFNREHPVMAEYQGMTGAEFMREVGDDVDKWTDAAMESALRHGMVLDHEWIRSLLADAMDAARRFSRPVVPLPVTEDDNP